MIVLSNVNSNTFVVFKCFTYGIYTKYSCLSVLLTKRQIKQFDMYKNLK